MVLWALAKLGLQPQSDVLLRHLQIIGGGWGEAGAAFGEEEEREDERGGGESATGRVSVDSEGKGTPGGPLPSLLHRRTGSGQASLAGAREITQLSQGSGPTSVSAVLWAVARIAGAKGGRLEGPTGGITEGRRGLSKRRLSSSSSSLKNRASVLGAVHARALGRILIRSLADPDQDLLPRGSRSSSEGPARRLGSGWSPREVATCLSSTARLGVIPPSPWLEAVIAEVPMYSPPAGSLMGSRQREAAIDPRVQGMDRLRGKEGKERRERGGVVGGVGTATMGFRDAAMTAHGLAETLRLLSSSSLTSEASGWQRYRSSARSRGPGASVASQGAQRRGSLSRRAMRYFYFQHSITKVYVHHQCPSELSEAYLTLTWILISFLRSLVTGTSLYLTPNQNPNPKPSLNLSCQVLRDGTVAMCCGGCWVGRGPRDGHAGGLPPTAPGLRDPGAPLRGQAEEKAAAIPHPHPDPGNCRRPPAGADSRCR